MKTLIIGGGKGCRSILDLMRSEFLKELSLEISAVVDINPNALGLVYARNIGLQTFNDMIEAIDKIKPEVIIELTGNRDITYKLYTTTNPKTKIIDHTIARIFWDILNVKNKLENQLDETVVLEKKLEAESHFLQNIFDNLADLAIVIDLKQRILRINKKFSKFTKKSPDEVIDRYCYDVITSPEMLCNKENSEELNKKIIENNQPITTIKISESSDENHWEITRSPIFDKDGKINSFLCTWRRITERVRLYRDKELAEYKFRSFINSAQDWISIKDLDGRYIIVNPVIANSFHLPVEQFAGKKPEEVFPEKLAQTINNHDKLVIKTRRPQYFDEIIPIDGIDHHFKTIRFPLTDYRGELIGVCTIARDTTKEVKLQEQLIQSEKLAAIGKLAAGVAHEINNPLSGILAFAENLQYELEDKPLLKSDVDVIVRETLRCRDIVRNLLDFARQDTPKLQTINPNAIIEITMSLVKKLPQFKDISIETNLNEKIPDISCDPLQMQQVLLNFMLNSADAMKYKGRIIITTGYNRRNTNCMISVEDSGPGIPENLMDKIFEPFFSTKGTSGLGLAVSWGIIERHHGTIEIDTAENGGAIFKIFIPAHLEF